MAENNLTLFQRLTNQFRSSRNNQISPDIISAPSQGTTVDRVLYTTTDKNDYERKLSSYRQQKYLAYQWKKASSDNQMESIAGYMGVKLMYRDVDLMDGTPEIGTALDIISEEACPLTSDGKMLNIYSKSSRTKSILEDLFVNRLHIYTELPMIARHMCKYGNTYELLNIDSNNGVMGWMMLPVYEIDRMENGFSAVYANNILTNNTNEIKPDEVKFIWAGHNENQPYFNWQIAHFRLLNDSFFLPYGVSMLHKARRAWRMWSMMEDAMLIWRLDKAIERRVFKIYVGGIDDADVPAYVQEIADNFKRTKIIDPETGMADVRKNFLDATSDFFIPVRREDAPNPIENLASPNSQVQMEDVEYMQNKMFCAMRVPKTFLNFQEAQGKGQNLSLMDVRFSRMINRVQQFLLMELNKIAMIHLYIMGLEDELGNFTLSLNNPSSQIEAQELTDLNARLAAMQTALSDPGVGFPMMSLHKALRDIMKMPDSEIKDMLNELFLEKAMAAEMQNAAAIIKDSTMFNSVKRIYGDYDAMNAQQPAVGGQQGGNDAMGGGGGLGGALGGGMGGDLGGGMGDDMGMDMGEPGAEMGGDAGGNEGTTDMGGAPSADAGMPAESARSQKPLLTEIVGKKPAVKSFTERYFDLISEKQKETEGCAIDEAYDFEMRNATLNEQAKKLLERFDGYEDIEDEEDDGIDNDVIDDFGDEII